MNDQTLPNHIAIIPDGNRRWAKQHGLPSFEGHRRGAETAVKIARYLRKIGIHTLTLWVFSTENITRNDDEVKNLMKLFERYIDRLFEDIIKDRVRTVHLGRRDRIPKSLLEKIENIEERTKDFEDYTLNIALDYGGRDEIIRAFNKINEEKLSNNHLNEENFSKYLDTAGQQYPDPDLIIRTSGELRTSGLMIWQAAYSEYIFIDKYFPDFLEKDIDDAINEYQTRKRRFGK